MILTIVVAVIVVVAVALAVAALFRRRTVREQTRMTTQTPSPPQWGDDALTSFLDLTRNQQFATFVKLRPSFDKMLQIDASFVRFHTDLTDPEDLVGPFFSVPAHAALRAATSLAMSTQISPAFAAMRQCLEAALYGLYISQNPDSFETWIKRTEDNAARQQMKKEFTIAKLQKTLESLDADTFSLWTRMYEKTIDFGAHPNPSALLSTLKKKEQEQGIRWEVSYLTNEPEVIGGTFKSVAQTGVISLRVFRHVFRSASRRLGSRSRLRPFKRDCRLLACPPTDMTSHKCA